MPNTRVGGNRWVPDIRPEKIETATEINEEQSEQYKIVDAHPILGGVLNKLAYFRTHAGAVWYNKLAGITVLQKLDNLASNIGVLAQLATTDKTSLVAAVNELNGKLEKEVLRASGSKDSVYGQNVSIVSLLLKAGKTYIVLGTVSASLGSGVESVSSTISIISGKAEFFMNQTTNTSGAHGGGTMSFMIIKCSENCAVAVVGYGYSNVSYKQQGSIVAFEV